MGPRKHVLHGVTLAQPGEYDCTSMCGGDAAFREITLTTC